MDVLKTFGFDSYEAEVSTWDNGVSGKYDGARISGNSQKAL
jgi:hypothetical protein